MTKTLHQLTPYSQMFAIVNNEEMWQEGGCKVQINPTTAAVMWQEGGCKVQINPTTAAVTKIKRPL